MNETAAQALRFLRNLVSVTFSTVGEEGTPEARIIDVMIVDEEGLHLITARGKPFFKQLQDRKKVAVCGMDEKYVTVRLVGDVKHCPERAAVDRVFEHNPGLANVYPGETRDILDAFLVYRAKGELFDLSSTPPRRERFAFGGETVNPPGYRITEDCIACGSCADACPVQAISEGQPHHIDPSLCLECGRCVEVCPVDAIEPALGL